MARWVSKTASCEADLVVCLLQRLLAYEDSETPRAPAYRRECLRHDALCYRHVSLCPDECAALPWHNPWPSAWLHALST